MNEIVNELAQLPQIEQQQRPTVTDQVFSELYRQVLSLELPPGTKMSEVDVAKAMGVSRQPVRDAFYRLSKMGFLLIRPQRATTVSLISPRAVVQARFIRSALEKETVRAAAVLLMAMGFDSLSMNATNLPKVKWMLRQVELSMAKDLLAELMTIDNPQVIHSSLQLALKNLGLTRMINPASAKTL